MTKGERISGIISGLVGLLELQGKSVVIETRDGSQRTGKLTDFTFRSIALPDGETAEVPMEIEVGDDKGDRIKVEWVASVKVVA